MADKTLSELLMKIKTDPVPALALLVALGALAVSVNSCVVADRAFNLSRVQFQQERQLALVGTFDKPAGADGCYAIKVSPQSKDFSFQGGTAYLPSQLYNEPIPIQDDGTFQHMGTVCSKLEDFIRSKVEAESGYVKISEGALPLLIKSFYATRGESYTDSSLYMITTMVMVRGDAPVGPSVTFKGLKLINHYSQQSPLDLRALDNMFDNPAGLYVRPRTP